MYSIAMSNKSGFKRPPLRVDSVFITGTDTGVGKTIVTAGLAMMLRELGMDVGVMKPIATGGILCQSKPHNAQLISADALFLLKATKINDPLELVNPICLKHPLAPSLAAQVSGKKINLKKIFSAYYTLRKRHKILLVEGIGGLLVPIKDNYLVADLVKDMNLPLLIVTRPTLGTINHTLLTIKVADDYGLKIKGFVINYHRPFNNGLAEQYAGRIIEEISGIKCLCELPYLKTPQRKELARGILSKSVFAATLRKIGTTFI